MGAAKSNKNRRITELERELEYSRGETAAAHRFIESLLTRETPKDMIESLLAGMAPLFLGYKDSSRDKRERMQDVITGMGSQGLDERGGVERGVWFPDIEFDETMEPPERWPTPGTISGSPTSQPGTTVHHVTNGEVQRTDGQQMFQAGQTGPPPVPEDQ